MTENKNALVIQNIINLLAYVDGENRVWGKDTDLGNVNTVSKLINAELEQLRAEAVEEHIRNKHVLEMDVEGIKLIEREARADVLKTFRDWYEKYNDEVLWNTSDCDADIRALIYTDVGGFKK